MISKKEFDNLTTSLSPSADTAAIARAYVAYTRLAKKETNLDAAEFIRSKAFPPEHILIATIQANLCNSIDSSCARLYSFFRERRISIVDTIYGYAVPLEAVSSLNDFISSTVSIRVIYERLCATHDIPVCPAEYAQLLNILGKRVIKERYNPCSLTTEYLISSESNATHIILSVLSSITRKNLPGADRIFTSKEASEHLGISEKTFLTWLKNHDGKNQGYISEDYLDEIDADWSICVEVNEQLLADIFADLGEDILTLATKHFRQWLKGNGCILPEGSLPQQEKRKMYVKDISTIKHVSAEFRSKAAFIPLRKLSEATGIQLKSIMDALCEECNRQSLCLTIDAYLQHLNCLTEYCTLDDIVRNIVNEESSSYQISRNSDRQSLTEFCDSSNWWGLKTQSSHGTIQPSLFSILIRREDIVSLSSHIRLFLRLYGLDGTEKFGALIRTNADRFPATAQMLENTFASRDDLSSNIWQMADMLFSYLHELDKEINNLAKNETEDLLSLFRKNCPLSVCNLFGYFVSENNLFLGTITFQRSGYTPDNSAYPIRDFATIVYYSCNFTAWTEADLIEKAINKKEFADLWLYVACHCYAAIRNTDYIRLDAPELYHSPEETLALFRAAGSQASGLSPDILADARKVTVSFLAKIQFRGMTPNKTSAHQGVSPISFFVPESNYDSFGVILSIAAAHYRINGCSGSFIVPTTAKPLCLSFFGEKFVEACGNKSFHSRRAAKSLMQAVELEARDGGKVSPYVAYSLASAMRSHKGGYEQLAETTKYYLSDANFSGLTPEYVAKQMLERGVCSFIIDHILEKCFGEKYKHLPVSSKTAVIKSTGLDAYQINRLRSSVLSAQNDIIAQVDDWIRCESDAYQFFNNLFMQHAQGKTFDCYCACLAADQKCPFTTRQHCFGCPFEIHSKASFIHYIKEWERLSKAMSTPTSDLEGKKYLYVQKNLIEPALLDILEHLSSDDVSAYLDLLNSFRDNHQLMPHIHNHI